MPDQTNLDPFVPEVLAEPYAVYAELRRRGVYQLPDTTINLLSSGLALLLQHPEQLALVTYDPTLIPNFVEEARIESPVQCLFRIKEATQIDGVRCAQRLPGRSVWPGQPGLPRSLSGGGVPGPDV